MQTERDEIRRVREADDTKDAAFLAQPVIVEGIGPELARRVCARRPWRIGAPSLGRCVGGHRGRARASS